MSGLKEYVSLWHKMRCRIYISKKDHKNAIIEGFKALKFQVNKKNLVFFCLAFFPSQLANKIIHKFS